MVVDHPSPILVAIRRTSGVLSGVLLRPGSDFAVVSLGRGSSNEFTKEIVGSGHYKGAPNLLLTRNNESTGTLIGANVYSSFITNTEKEFPSIFAV